MLCPYVPEPGRYWADTASIGPVLARFWHEKACLQGHSRTMIDFFFTGSVFSFVNCINFYPPLTLEKQDVYFLVLYTLQ